MIQLGKVPVLQVDKYSFQEVAKILKLRDGKIKLGRNLIMDILKKCNVLNHRGIAYQKFVDEGYFENHVLIHKPRVEVREDEYSLVIGQRGLDFVKKVITDYLVDHKSPFPAPIFGPCSGQCIL